MKITFYAHASFRFEADGIALITDPYNPAPGNSGFDPIDEAADLVIMSSATDAFHSDPSHVRRDDRPEVDHPDALLQPEKACRRSNPSTASSTGSTRPESPGSAAQSWS